MGRFPPRRAAGPLVVIAVVTSLAVAPAAPAAPATDKPDKQREATQLAQQLDAQGRQISVLDEQYNQARIKVDAVSAQLAGVEAKLDDASRNLAAARDRLRQAAVSAYVHGGTTPFLGALIKSRAEDVGVRRQYISAALADQREIFHAFDAARRQLVAMRDRLRKTKAQAQAAADAVATNRRQADTAIAAQRAALSRVQGELAPLVAAASQQQAAQQTAVVQAKFGALPATPAAAPAAGPGRTTTTTRRAAPAGSTPPTTAKPKPPAPVAGPPPPVSSGASAAVSTAKAQLGKPYEYGGAGPDSFDCSGLTMYSWHAGGVSLPHSAEMQYSAIPHVDVTALQPGDLVFFGSPIYHVGIYVGSGQMIEAPHTGANVRYASIFRSDLVGAGRP